VLRAIPLTVCGLPVKATDEHFSIRKVSIFVLRKCQASISVRANGPGCENGVGPGCEDGVGPEVNRWAVGWAIWWAIG
jgi:hypothetical protein